MMYRTRYLDKKHILFPSYAKRFIYKLHGDYLKEKIKCNYAKIMVDLHKCIASEIAWMVEEFEKAGTDLHFSPVVNDYDMTYID